MILLRPSAYQKTLQVGARQKPHKISRMSQSFSRFDFPPNTTDSYQLRDHQVHDGYLYLYIHGH